MLEQMRRSSQSLLIYVLFGIVIAVFIINFGPQSKGGCDAPDTGGSVPFAAKVDGSVLSPAGYRYAFLLAGGAQYPAQLAKQRHLKEMIMDKLIERELLAGEAERLGFRVSHEEVEDLISEAKIVGLGYEQTVPSIQKDGKFDYELFKRFVNFQLGLSPRSFIEEQRRELLATRVRQLVRGGVAVSADEVKDDFVRRGNQVNLEYVRVATRQHDSEAEPTQAETEAYATKNDAKLRELYTQRKFLYEKAPRERKLRQILVKMDAGGSADADKASDKGAEKKAEALAARVRKGESFATVAKASSDDARSKSRGGDIGWRRQGATTMGPAVEEKVWAAKDGEVVGPLKGTDGWYVVVPEGSREGDIPFEKVRSELAEDQLRQDKGKAAAKADADASLAKAKAAPTKTLKQVFPVATDAKGNETTGEGTIRAEETGLFSRRGSVVEGIGTSPELAKAAFQLTTENPFGGPYEVSGSYIFVKLKERKQADLAEFEKKKVELTREAALAKGESVVDEFAMRLCREAKEAKKIQVNRTMLRYEDGPETVTSYEPCAPPARM